ncbi:MAG TPA: hypothetical protein VE779_05050 [Candidatus Angelobacter sp.]|nr:hypothetical protein [Candidatus Angelobacter sp.]
MKPTLNCLGLYVLVLAAATSALAQGAVGPVAFQPSPELQKRVNSPSPAQGATNQTKKAVIGQGKTSIDTGDPKNSFWSETMDLSGAGQVVNADLLWDGSSKILYTFARTTLRCTHGRTTEGDLLVGIYGKRNFLGKQAGSGWWVVDLKQEECHAPLAGLYGCKFNPSGEPLACGRAELDPRINDMVIVESTRF